MTIENPIILQMIIDMTLLLVIVILLWRISAKLKKPINNEQKEQIRELKTVLRESQEASENFIHKMEQSRLALKEIALELDLKEKRVKTLLATPDNLSGQERQGRDAAAANDKYVKVVEMIKKGYSEAQTAESTGFTEAEIGLIIDLYKVKNERS